MKQKIISTWLFVIISVTLSADSDFCGIQNSSFSTGESITLKVFYNVVGLYVDAGTATFNVQLENYNGKPVFHAVGEGWSNSSYDWIFKVRDRYETYMDTATLRPYRFIRNVHEGNYTKYENATFNHEAGSVVTTRGVFKSPECIQDIISAVYYARNIDFSKYKPNDKINLSVYLDDEMHEIYIRYIGKEIIKTRYGKFRAIKFKPFLIKGTVFEGGEKMTVWVSDDGNHLPLRIESPIIVGNIKADMMGYRNLRYPLSSMIKFR
ncbi:MAG: DUF3108 domain-containing protein [Chitinophagaceae bacterium]|nr:DUF3108 domain-containing protein [Chitinophagaceae bacterium]